MAQMNALKGSTLLIMVGDGADPEVFAHPCLINTSRNFAMQADTEDYPTFDCEDPNAVTWKTREKTELSGDIEGSGRFYQNDVEFFDAWLRGAEPKNVKVSIDASAGVGGGTWTGAFHLTSFEIGAEGPKGTVECSIALTSTGEILPFAAAA